MAEESSFARRTAEGGCPHMGQLSLYRYPLGQSNNPARGRLFSESILKTMRKLAESAEAIAATPKRLLKTGIVADYLKSRTPDEAAVSAVFLSGRAFPAREETTLQVGGALLWR